MVRAALTALLATAVVVVATPKTATAVLPSGCTTQFTGNLSTDWGTAGNWTSGAVPGATSIACIQGGKTVSPNGVRTVQALHVDDFADVFIDAGEGLFVNGPTTSWWSPDSNVFVFDGRLGGTGRIDVHGFLELDGNSVLTSVNVAGGTAYGGAPGIVSVASDGLMHVYGTLALRTRYHLDIFGKAEVQSDALVSADWGTSMAIYPSGIFELRGNGGWYQGNPVAGEAVAVIGNHGVISKTSGSSNSSVIDANYLPSGGGHVEVVCCATLAIAGQQLVSGVLQPDQSLGTAACGVQTTSICGGSENPAIDVMSVKLDLDASNPATNAGVQELGTPTATIDSRAIGNEVYAHADQLAGPADPATITVRFSQADVMATPLNEIQVGHISDVSGVMTKTLDCVSGTIPAGANFCIVRPVFRDALNTKVTVLTTETSRWRVRRQLPGESFDQTAPGAARNLAATLAAPGDGSKVALSWAAPATDGGAAVTAYRVFRDGQLLFATDGSTSAVVSDPGPGAHTFGVVAVNTIGAGAAANVAMTIDKLSKPRGVKTVQGKKGGKLTAGATWKAPTDAGGFAIAKYKVAVFKKNGKKVDTKVVTASKLKYLFKLEPGRYYLKVKAGNTDRWGPWSKKTDLVRPR